MLKITPKNLLHPDYPFTPKNFPFFYGWIILIVCTIGVIMSIPGQTIGMSAFTDYLLAATGLSRLQLSNAYFFGTLTSGLLLPYGGILLDRFGARVTVVCASVGLALTLCYLSFSDRLAILISNAFPKIPYSTIALLILILGFVCLRFSGQGMLTMISRTTLGKWFNRRRGFVSGLNGVFMALGFSIAPLIFSSLINILGWRNAWLTMAAVVGIGMGLIGWLFYRDLPEECGLLMDGELQTSTVEVENSSENNLQDFTRAEAIATIMFWVVTLVLSSQALIVTGITFHIVDIGAEFGLSQVQTVSIFLPQAVVSTIVGYLMGVAADRVNIKYLFMVMMVSQAIGVASIANLGVPLFRVLTIVGFGISSGCFGTLSAVALPRFFGRAYLGAISGFQMMILVIASAIGPSFLAIFKDKLGSYQPGLYGCLILVILILILTFFARHPRKLDR
ncbi:nitrate/nitrite transporter [Okeania sp. SIO2B3]|uniref:MFS transporter n=1 Tax=Okeania sp. SIO2B3 TaxID=2607784 RepID=UPI0025E186C5|nr:MFS transporter [Okeania sp. SIO2B3]